MQKMVRFAFPALFFLGIVSCSSIDSDAKKAAGSSRQSIRYASEIEFDKAEKSYLEVQAYFKKYEQEGRLEEFSKLYKQYLIQK